MKRLVIGAIAAATFALTACGGPVPGDLIGQRLDSAEAELDQQGISYTEVGGGVFGIVVKSDWVVCSTSPVAGQTPSGNVELIVDHFACGVIPGQP
jgi:hypothetical protein